MSAETKAKLYFAGAGALFLFILFDTGTVDGWVLLGGLFGGGGRAHKSWRRGDSFRTLTATSCLRAFLWTFLLTAVFPPTDEIGRVGLAVVSGGFAAALWLPSALVLGIGLPPLLTHIPSKRSGAYELAESLRKNGNLPEAYAIFQQLTLNDPNELNWGSLGLTAAQMENWGEALRAFSEAAKVAPNSIDVRFNRAEALFHLGRKEEAAAELRAVLRADPSDAEAAALLRKSTAPALP